MATKVRFEHGNTPFYKELKKRADAYFEESGEPRTANGLMRFKVVFWVGSMVTLWALIMFGGFSALTTLFLTMAIGIALAAIGFNVGHDAIHGSFSDNPKVNSLLAWAFDFMGASSYTWSINHNYLHHTYPNIPGQDGDIEPGPMILLYPHDKRLFFHRFQHIYTLPLYCFTSLIWVFIKDFEQWVRPDIRTGKKHDSKHLPRLLTGKVLHVGFLLVAPLVLLDFPLWQIGVGYITMHFIGGFTLAIVFQLAHVVTGPEFPVPDEDGVIHNGWAEHQLQTTANFGDGNPLVTWIVGGLDYQIEHHLFPRVSHIHYPALSKIVRETTAEYGLPYLENKSVFGAVASHLRALKINGRTSGAEAFEALASMKTEHQRAA